MTDIREPIGITTTVPSEIIWAAGCRPIDLNNIFILSENRKEYIRAAERIGYPRNVCTWIKGMYGALALSGHGIRKVIAVTQGDCSNTHAFMETLSLLDIETIPFAYPYGRGLSQLETEMAHLAWTLGTTLDAAEKERYRLEEIRIMLDRLDYATWHENTVSGVENHTWLVSSSDCNGSRDKFSSTLSTFLREIEKRPPLEENIRLGYIGVPPIIDDLYDVLESFGARVVFNEVQRQFSMPCRAGSLIEQYRNYTYPYDIFHRLDYIEQEIERRSIHGVIHYVQSFCHRHIEDILVRERLNIPVLTIEGESPGRVDERTKIRLQAFCEMIAG